MGTSFFFYDTTKYNQKLTFKVHWFRSHIGRLCMIMHIIIANVSCPSIYVLWSSGISRKFAALIVRYSQKKKWISTVFYCSENTSIAHNLGTTGSIQVGFSAKCNAPNEHFNQIELKMSPVWVLTDFPRSPHI